MLARNRPLFAAIVTSLLLMTRPGLAADEEMMTVTETGRDEHPCVYLTPEDVARARERVEREPWASEYMRERIAAADRVVDHDPEWIREHCPEPGAAFAYGRSGCPICGAGWGGWSPSGQPPSTRCSFDRPGTVRCTNGHLLPDADHPDPGTGYVAEDGRIHYFVGSYNSWVVETYQQWCRDLSFAWLFTEDERYARTCAAILDAIAEIYPSCDKGSWDYPSDPPSGRLNRPWYQTARVLVTLVDYYDRIHDSAVLDEPSWVEGLTRRENIERNMLKNGAAYCYEQSLKGSLNNGEADYLRGALAVGCLLGIPEYIDWAIDGPFGIRAMVANNSDRDGRYTETSLPYAIHARKLYLTFAEPMINYRGGSYPDGLNLYDDPDFRSFYDLPGLTVDLAGHAPTYGDSAPDTKLQMPPEQPFDRTDYQFAERIAARASDPSVREHFRAIVLALAGDDLAGRRAGSGDAEWLLFHGAQIDADGPRAELPAHVHESLLLGQKGLAILRTPRGEHASACLLRYGPTLNHGHYDDLNINYVARGHEVTYDLGYAGGARHVQVGWAKQTAAHQLVVVDEQRQQPDTDVDETGGSLHAFAAMPGLALVEADADAVYRSRGVEDYRRLVALVGEGADSYLVDIFHVFGGGRHDYQAHSLSGHVALSAVELGPAERGSLAGEEFDWGDRLLNDGYLRGVPHKPYWVAPPGNGYGFMMAPRRAWTDAPWSATWTLPDHQRRMRLTVLPDGEMEVIATRAPGLRADLPDAACVTARRDGGEPLRSTFVALREAFAPDAEGTRGVREVDEGAVEFENQASLLVLEVELPAGEYSLGLSGSGPTTGSDSFFVTVGEGERRAFSVPKNAPGNATAIEAADLAAGPLTIERTGPRTIVIAPREHGPITLTELTFQREDEEPVRFTGADLLSAAQWAEAGEPLLSECSRHATAEGAAGLTVTHRSGLRDTFAHSSNGDRVEAGGMRLVGRFAHARFDGDSLHSLRLIGRSLTVGETELALERADYRGRIVSVDLERNRVRVDAPLPTDGRLVGQIVSFDNPAYSRNSAYTIRAVTRDGDASVIDLGSQRVLLGQGTLGDEAVRGDTLLSLTPHESARGLTRQGTDVFEGKLVTNADGSARASIVSTTWGQPYEVEVSSTEGFRPGDTIYYHDLQAGDEFLIRNWACALFDAAGEPTVHATDDVTVKIAGESRAIRWTARTSQE